MNINTSQIKKLIKLRKLNLRNTNTSDCSFIRALEAIEELNVDNNKNYHTCVRYFENRFDLKRLKISNISLTEKIANIGIGSDLFKKIIYFDASLNNISKMDGFENFESLIHLDLKFNSISLLFDSYTNFNFHRLSKLEFINLNKSIENNLINFEFKFGNKLEDAILSSNDLRIFPKFCEQDGSQQELLEFSCNLKTLHFDHNKLEKINQFDFIFLEKLEYLNLHSNNISHIEDDSFFNLKSLEFLILSDNRLHL